MASSSSSLSGFKSLLSSKHSSHSESPQSPAFLTFHGPDDSSQVVAKTPSSAQPVAHFIVSGSNSAFTISRLQNQPVPICEGKRSSLSGSTTLLIHGQEIKMKENQFTNSGYVEWKMDTQTMGKFKWVSGSLRGITLKDDAGTVVAKGSVSNAQLDVFVQADEILLDIILAAWVGLVKGKKAEEKEAIGVLKLVNALAGA